MADCIKQDPIGPAKAVWDVPYELVRQAYTRLESREKLFTTKASG